jgi:hypothetical protein
MSVPKPVLEITRTARDDRNARTTMKQLLHLAGVRPGSPERTLGVAIVGLTLLTLGGSASVLVWALALLN